MGVPELKPQEQEIFNKSHYVSQNIKSLPPGYLEEQRQIKAQRELEAQKKFLQQELDISKKQVQGQHDEFEKNVEQFKQEMLYRHKEELDRAQKRVTEKDTEVESLKKLIGIPVTPYISLAAFFHPFRSLT